MSNNIFFKNLSQKDAEMISHAVSAGILESIELMAKLIKVFRLKPELFKLEKGENEGE